MRALLLLLLAGIPAFSQNPIPFQPGSLYAVNAASRRAAVSLESGFAPGSLCDISTRGLYQPQGELPQGEQVTLQFRTPGATVARDLTILSRTTPLDLTVLIPPDAAAGEAQILAVAASKVFSLRVWIAASGFGMFTKLGQGYDAAAAQVWREGPRTVSLTAPVQAGEWVTLWGTGLGKSQPTVVVGGIAVSPSYAGAAPELPGVDQINFQFPAGVPNDCYIPLTVSADGRAQHTVSIAAGSGPGPCRHRLGLSAADLAALDAGRTVPFSQTWVHSDVLPNFNGDGMYRRFDTATLDFTRYDAARLQAITGLLIPQAASCQLSIGGGTGAFITQLPPLDAGTPTLKGPDGVSVAMEGTFGHFSTPVSETAYPLDKLPSSQFSAGDWAVAAPGGKDIAPFQAALRIPTPLRWTNRASIAAVSRASDLVLTWDAAGYTEREWMQGSISAGSGYIACQAPATAGSITIPSSLLSQLPDSMVAKPLVQLLLTPASGNPVLYPVPLVGGGSFAGVATFSYLEAVTVDLQ